MNFLFLVPAFYPSDDPYLVNITQVKDIEKKDSHFSGGKFGDRFQTSTHEYERARGEEGVWWKYDINEKGEIVMSEPGLPQCDKVGEDVVRAAWSDPTEVPAITRSLEKFFREKDPGCAVIHMLDGSKIETSLSREQLFKALGVVVVQG